MPRSNNIAMKPSHPLIFLMASLSPGLAWSVDPQHDLQRVPQHIDVYGLAFTPTLDIAESYDYNFRELEHNIQSSSVTKLAPTFELKAEDRNSGTRLIYQPTRYIFHSEPDASHTDQRLRLDSIMEFTDRHRLELEAQVRQYELTSSTAVDGINDKFRSDRVGGTYTYGAKSASNQIALGGNYGQLRSQNADGINDDKERNTTALTSTWYHRLGSNTRSILEYDHTRFDYLSDNLRSSKADAVLAGAVWDFTARTTGKVRIGFEHKNFDDSSVKDLDNPTWQVDLQWKPRTYSVFTFVTRQALAEGDDGSDAIKTTTTKLGWRHGWTERITTFADAGLSHYVYKGQDRTDDLHEYNLGVEYAMRRWLGINLSYRYRNDNSDAEDQSFTRHIYMISVTGTL
ncbi:MAG: hypothetical protein JWP80_1739 [Pseudomonas sp.]|nr:hypothetical protein [Pseudomonas sp.]